MSAAEIIEEIKKLPASEQERIRAFFESQGKGESGARYAENGEFEHSAEKVLRDHAELFRRLAQ